MTDEDNEEARKKHKQGEIPELECESKMGWCFKNHLSLTTTKTTLAMTQGTLLSEPSAMFKSMLTAFGENVIILQTTSDLECIPVHILFDREDRIEMCLKSHLDFDPDSRCPAVLSQVITSLSLPETVAHCVAAYLNGPSHIRLKSFVTQVLAAIQQSHSTDILVGCYLNGRIRRCPTDDRALELFLSQTPGVCVDKQREPSADLVRLRQKLQRERQQKQQQTETKAIVT